MSDVNGKTILTDCSGVLMDGDWELGYSVGLTQNST